MNYGVAVPFSTEGPSMFEMQQSDSMEDFLFSSGAIYETPAGERMSDFFIGFREVLAAREDTSAVLSIPDAYTPVLKFTIDGQAIDMVFASLHMPRLPEDLDILDLRLMRGLDDASVRSINGPRVAEWIVRLVPNIDNFCSALRVIKYWARQRGLYSNMLGFLGGISYAILVAQVCQLFVFACPFTLVRKFFEVYAIRDWRNHPVMLRSYEDVQVEDAEGRPLPVWDARVNTKDAAHLMPIITPAYPAMNSAFNVSWPQHLRIKEEIARGCKLFQAHAGNKKFPWNNLFEPFNQEFFKQYPRYVKVDILSIEENDHRNWFGWVESRLRHLILNLDQLGPAPVPNKPVTSCCHPIANCFHRCVYASEAGLPPATTAAANPGVAPSILNAAVVNAAAKAMPSAQQAIDVTSETGSIEHAQSLSNGTEDSVHNRTPGKDAAPSDSMQQQQQQQQEHQEVFMSSYLIGLSMEKKGELDTEPAVQDFTYKVMSWAYRKESMWLKISLCKKDELPDFLHKMPALPSDVRSCTPQLQRLAPAPSDVSGVSAQLFPSSAQKPVLPRDPSETGLSATFPTSSSLSDSVNERCSPRKTAPASATSAAAVAALFPENAVGSHGSPRAGMRSPLSVRTTHPNAPNGVHEKFHGEFPAAAPHVAPLGSPSYGGASQAAAAMPERVAFGMQGMTEMPAGTSIASGASSGLGGELGYVDLSALSPASTEYYSPHAHPAALYAHRAGGEVAQGEGARMPPRDSYSPDGATLEYYAPAPPVPPVPFSFAQPHGVATAPLPVPGRGAVAARAMPFPPMIGAAAAAAAAGYPAGYGSSDIALPPSLPLQLPLPLPPQYQLSSPKRYRNERAPGSQGSSGSVGSGSGTENGGGHVRRQKFGAN